MNVPIEILEKLKCSNCVELLSCGPVLINHDGSNICGRCSILEKTAVHNEPYNLLAELCVFPCKYSTEGCYKKLPFSSVKQHEADCEYRTYICPVSASGSCEWVGSRNKILEHTRDAHPQQVLEHPCNMQHDVKTSSFNTFLMTAFKVLFLVHVKVCLTTHSIYHSVRKIGEIHDTHFFKFQVNIGNENGNIIRKGKVASQGCLALQEHTSVGTKINTIMEALSGYDDATCTITLEEFMKCFMCAVVKKADEMNVYDIINNIFYCKTCLSTLDSCTSASKGCIWKGRNINHQKYFCTKSEWCNICQDEIDEYNMIEHMRTMKHTGFHFNHLTDKYWRIHKNTKRETVTICFKNVSYLLTCSKKKKSSKHFYLQGCDDANMNCMLILANPRTGYISHFNMNKKFYPPMGQFIFEILLDTNQLQRFVNDVDNEFDIGVDIYSYN